MIIKPLFHVSALTKWVSNRLHSSKSPPFFTRGCENLCEAKWGMQMIMERIALTLTDSITAKRYENPSVVFPTLKKGG